MIEEHNFSCMDGVDSSDGIIGIGTTNTPWSLNHSFLRRFPKQIYVTLPEKTDRVLILRQKFDSNSTEHELTDADFCSLAAMTDG